GWPHPRWPGRPTARATGPARPTPSRCRAGRAGSGGDGSGGDGSGGVGATTVSDEPLGMQTFRGGRARTPRQHRTVTTRAPEDDATMRGPPRLADGWGVANGPDMP